MRCVPCGVSRLYSLKRPRLNRLDASDHITWLHGQKSSHVSHPNRLTDPHGTQSSRHSVDSEGHTHIGHVGVGVRKGALQIHLCQDMAVVAVRRFTSLRSKCSCPWVWDALGSFLSIPITRVRLCIPTYLFFGEIPKLSDKWPTCCRPGPRPGCSKGTPRNRP